MNTKDKLLEWLRGEREWEQQAMARECLVEIERLEEEADDYWQRIGSLT